MVLKMADAKVYPMEKIMADLSAALSVASRVACLDASSAALKDALTAVYLVETKGETKVE